MGGCRCSFKNCANTTKTRENLHFFHYPVKQKERCRLWIENALKPQFYDLDEDQLRNKVICETHFENCYFPNAQKKRLLQGAVPTLDGDCVQEPGPESLTPVMKIQDVQVLPANADGTIFVLDTHHMQQHFRSEKIESYIYTNNGLVLPISKCGDSVNGNIQNIYSNDEIEEIEIIDMKKERSENISEISANENYVLRPESVHAEEISTSELQIVPKLKRPIQKVAEPIGNKYVKTIKQHSKDIALIKKILQKRSPYRKPNNSVIMRTLSPQIPSTLLSVINLQLDQACKPNDLEFFSTIHSISPEVYKVLTDKYKWKLPDPISLTRGAVKKNNGHISCSDE